MFVTPGLTLAEAEVLGNRFHELDGALDITVVLDSDEDVCRIGYGEALSVVTLTLTSSNVATKSKFAQFPQQRHAASSLQHSLNQDLTVIAGSAQIMGKPSLNRTRLDPLLINMKLTDPAHQTCRRMQGLVEQRKRMTGATPIRARPSTWIHSTFY